jgi:hypothetical protein
MVSLLRYYNELREWSVISGNDLDIGRTPVSDTNYTQTLDNIQIAYTTLTVSRVISLLPASSFAPGQQIIIRDDSGSASSTVTISAKPNGTDKINGSNTTQIMVNAPFGAVWLESNGVSSWTTGNLVQAPTRVSLGIDSRTPVSNVNYTVLATDYNIAYITLTASRVVSLPAASSYSSGRLLAIRDDSGSASATKTISAKPNGTDDINGSNTTQAMINSPFGVVMLESDGVSNWTVYLVQAPTRVSLGIDSRTPVADTNYTVLATDYNIAYTSLTAARTVLLPAASSYSPGRLLVVRDDSGQSTSTITVSISPNLSDLINGVNSSTVVLNSPWAMAFIESDGVSKWTINPDLDAKLTPHGDTNFVMVAADTTTNITATYTAPRTGTLPAANAVVAGAPYLVGDQAGGVTKASPLTLARAGSDTVNGGVSIIAIDNPNNAAIGFSDGVSKWSFFSLVSRFIQPFTGAINRTLASIFSDWPVRPQDFSTLSGNPVGTGSDDTQAIQAAINTGKTVYLPKTASGYLLNSTALNCTTAGQLIYGDGIEGGTIINVGTGFIGIGAGAPTAGTNGVFKFNSGEPGPHIRGLTITGAQPNNVTTSASSNTIGTGSKTFTVGSGLTYFVAGYTVYIYDTANPANTMTGSVSSYSGTTLVVSISSVTGSGTFTTWTIQCAALANQNQYPPAVWCAYSSTTASQARFILEDILIYGFPTGIDMRGNNGGAYLRNVWLGCLGNNILIDGCLDVVQINSLRVWPFGLKNNAELAIFCAGGTNGIYVYRCDGLYIDNATFICNDQLQIDTSVASAYSLGGGMFGVAAATEFDSFNGIIMNDAAGIGGSSFSVAGSFLSMGGPAFISTNIAAGHLNISTSIFNCQFDQTALACGGGLLNATGNTFVCGNFARSNTVINVTSGTVILIGNTPDGPTVSGNFITTAAGSQFHRVIGNGKNTGWTNSLGANTNAIYANN